MVSLTDDDKTQLGQLIDYLFTRRETIADRWLTKCSLDEDFHPFTPCSQEEFMDQLLLLLPILVQRITGDFSARDLVERIGQHERYRWQRGYSLAELILESDNFYDVLDEQFQQFLELYPQTQPRVITHVYSQLLRLSKEANRGNIVYVDQLRQLGVDEQVQTIQAVLDNLHQLARQRIDHLQQAVHDLHSRFSILSTAISLLQGPLNADDRAKFMDMVSRNIKVVGHQLDQMLAYAQLEASQASPVSDKEASQSAPLTDE